MPSRTQIVCLHEGKKGRSIAPIFIRAILKALDPPGSARGGETT